MVSVTEAIQGLDIGILKSIGWLINNEIIFGLLILGLVARFENRKKTIIALILGFLVGFAIKEMAELNRPCFGEENCPADYSFPSHHAIFAFTLAVARLKKNDFIYYLLFAIFVAFTRINIGVHTFYDIEGALPIAIISYYAVSLWNSKDN